MPREASWLERVPAIIEQLEAASLPVLDRAAVEQLFGLGRRQAIRLMGSCGGYVSGRTGLVDRTRMLEFLRQMEADGAVEFAVVRKARIMEVLRQARRESQSRGIRIPVEPQIFEQQLESLPAGVSLEPGKLTVDFREPVELLEKLFALTQAMANDFHKLEDYARRERAAP